jgi:hypothetical protein
MRLRVSMAFFVHEAVIVRERRVDGRASTCSMEVRAACRVRGAGEKAVVADTHVRVSVAVPLDDTAVVWLHRIDGRALGRRMDVRGCVSSEGTRGGGGGGGPGHTFQRVRGHRCERNGHRSAM